MCDTNFHLTVVCLGRIVRLVYRLTSSIWLYPNQNSRVIDWVYSEKRYTAT